MDTDPLEEIKVREAELEQRFWDQERRFRRLVFVTTLVALLLGALGGAIWRDHTVKRVEVITCGGMEV
jgi:hypothetical protein